jgi:FkbH-like protein
MRNDLGEMDYFTLAKEAKTLDTGRCVRTARLAVLADFATQHLVPILKVLAARNGTRLDVYEADYDQIDVDILNPQSGLYEFDPQYAAILVASEKLKSRFYESDDQGAFAETSIGRFKNLWEVLRQHSAATVIQGTYVLPSERAFGNYELKAADSLGAAFAAVNHGLAEHARQVRNVLLCDVDHVAAEIGRRNWFDSRLWSLAKTPCRLEHLPLLAQNLVDIVLAASGQLCKCVVLDLDNTLWGGVIGDDGLSGIALGDFDEGEAFVDFQKFLRELKRRGIILAVVSKNEKSNALLPFHEHPKMVLKEDDIAVFVANWENKADNIRLVRKVLNISFDSMVFLDDNPFERNLVRELLPDVVVPELPEDPSLYIEKIGSLNLFETASYSSADLQRPGQYREEAQRELDKTRHTNITDYLVSLDMKIKLERFKPFNLPRIAQLIQRSNQFNLTTRRYSEAVCESLMNDPQNAAPFTLTLSDKFGDYGLISIVILKLKGAEIEIDEYLMSCRVLKRGVEQFAMNQIFDFAARKGAKRVLGHYVRTAKNEMVKSFFEDFGFEKISAPVDGNTNWELEIEKYKPTVTFFDPLTIEL